MATNFPNSPSNGATHVFGGTTYTYNSTKGVWKADKDAVAVSDTPPSNPETGALWFDSSVAKTYIYYNDGSSSQWVQLNPSGGSDGADGADGATGGESPVILTEPPSSHTLNNDGTTNTLTMTAQDPEGFDVTYGIAYKTAGNTLPAQLASAPSINQTTGVYTFTPSSTSTDAGTFRARLSASDGANTTTRLIDFSLVFTISADFLVVAGGGGGAGWGGGGGGAGGLRTSYGSYSGGGASAETSAAFEPGATYAITIGDGGVGGGSAGTTNYEGVDGANSSIAGTGVNIVSIGGGGGGGGNAATVGRDGGSGGGGGTNLAGGSGTTGQGYAGGFGDSDTGHPYGHGGGGGAGAVGFDDAGNTTDSGAGGAGLQVNIDGNNYYWAGGGGGGAHNGTGTRFSDGGIGGGGGGSGYEIGGAGGGSALNAGQNGSTYGSAVGAGGTNTGGGGGGAAGGARVGGQGGSGIVIIRAAQTATATTGSPTVTTVGSDTVYTFTSSGTIRFD